MVDAVQIFPPGFRATDANGDPITDGILHFFDSGTSNPKTVYSAADLSAPSALGTTVGCNSAGIPVTSGNIPTMIYTGSAPYKIRLASVILGGTVWEFDGVKGALDTSAFLTSAFTPSKTAVNIAANYNVGVVDKGKFLKVNVSGADVAVTFDTAANLGNGFWIGISLSVGINKVRIASGAADNFKLNGGTTTNFVLTRPGQTIYVVCDGVDFYVDGQVPSFIADAGIVRIVSRTNTPPAAASGDRHIVTAAPTGAWATFPEHAIAEFGFSGWFHYVPQDNAGWTAFVIAEQTFYHFRSATWVPNVATAAIPGAILLANLADMEAATHPSSAVTPVLQHRHPAHPKAWAYITYSAGVPTLQASYGVASITDAGVGALAINLSVPFSSVNWGDSLSGQAAIPINVSVNGKNASTINVLITDMAGGAVDPAAISFSAFGDQ